MKENNDKNEKLNLQFKISEYYLSLASTYLMLARANSGCRSYINLGQIAARKSLEARACEDLEELDAWKDFLAMEMVEIEKSAMDAAIYGQGQLMVTSEEIKAIKMKDFLKY